MTADEVLAKQAQGYHPEEYCANNDVIDKAINKMYHGINGCTFEEVANSLKFKDPYMVLADFDAYQSAQQYVSECYKDVSKWNKMSLHNIAGAGIFSAPAVFGGGRLSLHAFRVCFVIFNLTYIVHDTKRSLQTMIPPIWAGIIVNKRYCNISTLNSQNSNSDCTLPCHTLYLGRG